MGDTLSQVNTFKNQITNLLEPTQFDKLSDQLKEVVNKDRLKSLLQYVLTIPNARLQRFGLANGQIFLREKTNQVFSFFIGRDYDGTYGLTLTQNGKSPDGEAGTAIGKEEGTYKSGKIAQGIDLISGDSGESTRYYRLRFKDVGEAESEMSFCRAVNSPFVARYLSTNKYKHADKIQKQAVFLKYAKHGDVLHFLKSPAGQNISRLEKRKMIYTLLAGVRHIHNTVHPNQKNMRHRDIKTQNLLRLENGAVLIIDFGGWDCLEGEARTYDYSPPEFLESCFRADPKTIEKCHYWKTPSKNFWSKTPKEDREFWPQRISGMKADVWGAAQCCYEIFRSAYPTVAGLQDFDKQNFEFLHKMFAVNPDDRCNMDEALSIFLRNQELRLSAAEQKTWMQDMIKLYTNDFHRMQFLSELEQSGCKEFLKYIPAAKKQLMKIEELMKWDSFLTLSEWYRIRDLYAPRSTRAEMKLFDSLLDKRPEFQPNLVGSSLWYAMRIDDQRVIKKIERKKCDVSKLFKDICKYQMSYKYAELVWNGHCPWFFAGNYTDAEAIWMLTRNSNAYSLKQFIDDPAKLNHFNLFIQAMIKYNVHKTWQGVITQYVNEHLLTAELLNKFINAGLDREMLAKYVLLQIPINDAINNSTLNREIIQWCTQFKHSHNDSLDEEISQSIQFHSKLQQSAEDKVNCYKELIERFKSYFSEEQWEIELHKVSIMHQIIPPELSEDKLDAEDESEKNQMLSLFRLTRFRERNSREAIVDKIIDVSTIKAANKLMELNPQWLEESHIGHKRMAPMSQTKESPPIRHKKN